jgi:hypothetical protein
MELASPTSKFRMKRDFGKILSAEHSKEVYKAHG